ncbi:hypothetical protein [Labrenzia sp. PHM005]|uniref:hypothetical protein n=1 Tax=Labrenzia sp. PHM005 TaxID=2590016 RepID=UPI001140897C|nr:hypothetical protein [Labrenzia sp. PHM005]QDG74737.1 hypothetical protein FJ695_02010 [Labrenzia sp. PHM005]
MTKRLLPSSLSGSTRVFLFLVLGAFLSACGHVPLTTIAKLSQFDMLETNPDALRLAVKYPEGIQIPQGGATMALTLKRKQDGVVLMEEELAFEEVVSKAEKAELSQELQDGWRLEIYRLPEENLPFFRSFQKHMASMSKSEREKVEGTLNIGVSGCLLTAEKPSDIRVSTFLKAAELGGYVTLLRNFDLEEQMTELGGENGLDRCPDAA